MSCFATIWIIGMMFTAPIFFEESDKWYARILQAILLTAFWPIILGICAARFINKNGEAD